MNEYDGDVKVFGLAGRDDIAASQAFVDEFGVSDFEHLFDETGEIWERFGIVSQPAFIYIDDDGDIDSRIGSLGEDGIRDAIAELEST